MTITITAVEVTPKQVKITGTDLDYLMSEDWDEQIEEREYNFCFDRKIRHHLIYLSKILTSKKCQQSTMTERVNALLGTTTSISPSFICKD